MAFVIVKRPGAPSGALSPSVGNKTYSIDDTTPITVTDSAEAADLARHPWLQYQGATVLPYPTTPQGAVDWTLRRRQVPPGKTIVTNRNLSLREFPVGGVGHTHHRTFKVLTSATDLVFRFMHYSIAAVKEAVPGSSLTVRASVRVNGQNHEITRDGDRDLVINVGAGFVDSDPVPVEVKAGTSIIVNTYLVAAATLPYSTDFSDGTYGGTYGDTYTLSTDATGPAAAVGVGTSAHLYGPSAVFGSPQSGATVKPSVAILGDSVARGTGDAPGTGYPGGGFVAAALDTAGLPWVNVSRASISGNDLTDSYGRKLRAGLVADCAYAVVRLGANDIYAQARTALQAETSLISVVNAVLAARGVVAYVCTTTPVSTSTDSWATTGNQTTDAKNGVRVALNNWIRAGLPVDSSLNPVAVGTTGALLCGQTGHPVAGYFESADAVESARDSGLWKAPGYTADGTHPTAAGHTTLAPTIDVTRFV